MAEVEKRALPEGQLTHDFLITDETVNRKGWRILVDGIDLQGFLKNPVCCVQHNTELIPVGRWLNVRVDQHRLLGTVEFDRHDEFAVKLYWKYKDGYMNAVSLNVEPIKESNDEELLLPGQSFATVVESELLEISLVTLPGQKNAVKLSKPGGGEYKLSLIPKNVEMDKSGKKIEELEAQLAKANQVNAESLVLMHKHRGVVADAEIESLKTLAISNYDTVKTMLEARVAENKQEDDRAATLVQLHFTRGAIMSEEKDFFEKSAKLDYEGTKKLLEQRRGTADFKSFVAKLSDGDGKDKELEDDERKKWTFLDWYKKDPEGLKKMEKEDPEKYARLAGDFDEENKKLGIYPRKG